MKITILNTITQVMIGRFLQQAYKNLGHEAEWFDLRKIDKKPPVKLRHTLAQIRHQKRQNQTYSTCSSRSEKQLLVSLEKLEPELIIVIGSLFPLLSTKFINTVKQRFGIPVVLWDSNGINHMQEPKKFQHFVTQELNLYDHVFCVFKRMVEHYKHINLKHVSWLPYGVSAEPIKQGAAAPPQHDVVF